MSEHDEIMKQMTDAELSRRIAELQGWQRIEKGWYHPLNPLDTQQDAPHYASDMNAAVELLRECFGELTWDGEAWQVEAHGYLYASHPTNPARAVCEVWLQAKQGQQ